MDALVVSIWIVRIAFLVLLYVFLATVARVLLRDLRAAASERAVELGRLVTIESPGSEPRTGSVFALDTVTTLGRDVNNTIVVDDTYASGEHAALTWRGRAWFLEDLGSTNGTFVNGGTIDGVQPLGFGDEIQVGRVRFRLERSSR